MKFEGYKATELAKELGIAVSTIYNWKEVPSWAVAYLCLKEEVKNLRQENKTLRSLL